MSPWTWVAVILALVPVVLLWMYSVTDLMTRDDISVIKKATWIVPIVFVPLVGAVLYIVFRPSKAGDIRGFGRRHRDNTRVDQLLARADEDQGS